jgi:hypothetical protein
MNRSISHLTVAQQSGCAVERRQLIAQGCRPPLDRSPDGGQFILANPGAFSQRLAAIAVALWVGSKNRCSSWKSASRRPRRVTVKSASELIA